MRVILLTPGSFQPFLEEYLCPDLNSHLGQFFRPHPRVRGLVSYTSSESGEMGYTSTLSVGGRGRRWELWDSREEPG